MKRFLMNSGGKDSMASTIYAYENGIELDGVVISEVMFDHSRNISAEHPLHAKWLHEFAIPFIKCKFGYNVILVKSSKDYISIFNERYVRSKFPDRIGKKRGFPFGKGCFINDQLKVKPLNHWCREQGDFEKILGLAYDEKERLLKIHNRKNERSFLEEGKIVEAQTFDICRSYGLLSPFYDLGLKRQGCWFCPNCSINEFAVFADLYPDLWNELRILSKDKDIASPFFKYERTFDYVDKRVSLINNQMSIFDLCRYHE